MTKFLTTLVILTTTTLASGPQEKPGEWVKFTSGEGRFSVLMPVQPTSNSETKNDGSIGPYTSHLFTAKGERELYLAGWVDYDPKFNFGVQAELEANRDNFVKGVNAKLLSTNRISLGEYPGLEFTAASDQAFFKSRVYVVGRRPYQLIAVVLNANAATPDSDRFLTSFEIKPDR